MLRAGPLSGFQSLVWNRRATCHFERGAFSSNLKSKRSLLSTEMTEVDWPPQASLDFAAEISPICKAL
jgi:hypothetical protein